MDIAPLSDRLFALEAENAALRSRLQSCEQAYALLQAEVFEWRRQQQHPAQLQPAPRAVNLTSANQVLKRSLELLSTDPDLDKFVGYVLTAIAQQFQSPLTEYWSQNEHTAFIEQMYWQGQILDRSAIAQVFPSHAGLEGFRVPSAMIGGIPLCQRKNPIVYDDHSANPFTKDLQWVICALVPLGLPKEINVPLFLGDSTIGALTIHVPREHQFTAEQVELAQALAHQVTLAAEMQRLAQESKQAAIAREQEHAAQERVAELAKANDAIKRSLNAIAIDADPGQIIAHILKIVAEQFETPLVEYWTHSETCSTAQLNLTYWQGQFLSPAQQPGHPGNLAFPCFPCLKWDHNSDYPPYFLIEDITTDPHIGQVSAQIDTDVGAWFSQRGVTRLLNIPLWLNEKTIGALDIWLPSHRCFNRSQIDLAYTFGQQITLASYLNQMFTEVQQTILLEERNRIASDIHDTLAQAFTGISLQLEVAKPLIQQEPQTVEQILQHISQLAKNGLAEARRSVWALYPPGAEYANLAQMLYDSVEQMSRNTPISIQVNLLGQPCPIAPYIGMNLLRIGQEALTNALKHSQAQAVWIELTYTPDLVLLSIRDNGRGFTPPTNLDNLNGGFGLVGMYERCDRIGAQISILSQPGQGTQILVESALH